MTESRWAWVSFEHPLAVSTVFIGAR